MARKPENLVAALGQIRGTRSVGEKNQLLQKKANRIWVAAAPTFGKSPNSPAPKIWQGNLDNPQEAESVHQGFDGAARTGVKFGGKLASALLDPESNLSNTAKETLIHEWTHQFQPQRPITPQTEWKSEGGAESLARRKAPGIYKQAGIGYHNPQYNGYPRFTHEVNQKLGQRWVENGQLKPLFGPNAESNQNFGAAYKHNQAWAKPSDTNYQTKLNPTAEKHFRQWVRNNDVPFDPNATRVDYDMRGYWLQTHGKTWRGGETHFPDAYKTPYDATFSKWSKYAKKGTPFVWRKGNRLVNRNTGRVIFGAGT